MKGRQIRAVLSSDVAPRSAGAEAGTGTGIPARLFVLLFLLLTSAPANGTTIADVGQEIPNAGLLWEAGNYIYHSTIGNWNPQQIKPGFRPKWSPDGTRIAYSVGDRLHVMNADFTGDTQLITGINTSWWGTAYSWTRDGQYVTVLMGDQRTVRKVNASGGGSTVIYTDPSQDLGEAAEIDVTGRYLVLFRADPNHIRVWDLQSNSAENNPSGLGANCTPAWAPDGSYFTSTDDSTPREIVKCTFDASSGSIGNPTYFIGLDGIQGGSYICHFSRVSNDGNWLVLCGAPGFGETYRVYLWKIGDPKQNVVQMTTGEGRSPDLFVPTGTTNYRPSVNAGPDRSITLPDDTVSLDGTVTDDGLPDPPGSVTTTWSKVSGPGTVTFGNVSAVDTTAKLSVDGTYVLRLTADDGALSASDEVAVTLYPEGGMVLKINVGPDGGSVPGWVDDDPYRSGGTEFSDWIGYPVDLNNQPDPAPEAVYTTIVHQNHSFAIPVPNATYRVRMHFYDGFDTYQRSMDFTFEGQLLFDDIDILTEAGGKQKALIKEVQVEVTDGVLNIVCSRSQDVFESGIEVIDLGGGGPDVAILGFTASPSTMTQGQSATLSWSTSNATSVTIDQGIGDVSADGTRNVSPGSTTTYTLTAQGPGGPKTKQATVTVTVTQPTVITNPAASGAEFTEGDFAVFEGTGTSLVWTYDIASDGAGPQQFGTGTFATMVAPTGLPALPATLTVTLTGDGGTDTQTHTIIAATEPTVTVTSPNGGEILFPGQEWHIRWEAVIVDNVSILYSVDGGSHWEVADISVLKTSPQWSDYAWTVPDAISSQCLVSVADYSGSPADESDAVFEISPDTDGDSLPDAWEVLYFGDTLGDADADYDSDGYSNLDEYVGASDPTDGASVPAVDGTDGQGGTGFACTVAGGAGPEARGGLAFLALGVCLLVAVGLRRRGANCQARP